MNTLRATRAFEASLRRQSSTPDYGASSREDYLAKEVEKLRGLATEPRSVRACARGWAADHGDFAAGEYEMVVVAGEGSSWLLYDEESDAFCQARGDLEGELQLVGFRSKDALAEWLG